MTKKFVLIGLIYLLHASCVTPLIINIEVAGIVTDASNGLPISNVSVRLERRNSMFFGSYKPSPASTTTDTNGYYYLSWEPEKDLESTLSVVFVCLGYYSTSYRISTKESKHTVNMELTPWNIS